MSGKKILRPERKMVALTNTSYTYKWSTTATSDFLEVSCRRRIIDPTLGDFVLFHILLGKETTQKKKKTGLHGKFSVKYRRPPWRQTQQARPCRFEKATSRQATTISNETDWSARFTRLPSAMWHLSEALLMGSSHRRIHGVNPKDWRGIFVRGGARAKLAKGLTAHYCARQ